jgi:hypothetical protein
VVIIIAIRHDLELHKAKGWFAADVLIFAVPFAAPAHLHVSM